MRPVDVLNNLKGYVLWPQSYHLSEDEARTCIEALEQQKTGEWIAYEVQLPDRTILNYRCSVCGRKLIGYNTETLSEAPFCHCGAKMAEPQESDIEKRKEWSHKPCINYEDGCEEWAGCPCVYYKAESEEV